MSIIYKRGCPKSKTLTSQNGRDRLPYFLVRRACLTGLSRQASLLALIAMTQIFRHLLIMPQEFGVNSRNDDFLNILFVYI